MVRQTPQQIVDRVLELPDGTRFQVLAPVVRGRKGTYETLLGELATDGFVRAVVDGEQIELGGELPELARYETHDIKVVVDRLVRRDGIDRRLTDSMETALRLAEGVAEIEIVPPKGSDGEPQTLVFSQHLARPSDGKSFEELAPRNFSFNSPYGACSSCDGLGTTFEVDPQLVVPNGDLTLGQGAIHPWAGGRTGTSPAWWRRCVRSTASPPTSRGTTWRPSSARSCSMARRRPRSPCATPTATAGSGPTTPPSRVWCLSAPPPLRVRLGEPAGADRGVHAGGALPGLRWGSAQPLSLACLIDGRSIDDLCRLSIGEAAKVITGLELSERDHLIADRVIKEINARLSFLLDVGLDYLSLGRSAATLSGGEAQRIRLASQVGSGLVGVLYVLDEPSIGLHQRDNAKLIQTWCRLRDLGNTVLVVEHDEETIKVADHVVDIGPGAGEHGGAVVYSGGVSGLLKKKASMTGQYLAGKKTIPVPASRRPADGPRLVVRGAREHT